MRRQESGGRGARRSLEDSAVPGGAWDREQTMGGAWDREQTIGQSLEVGRALLPAQSEDGQPRRLVVKALGSVCKGKNKTGV